MTNDALGPSPQTQVLCMMTSTRSQYLGDTLDLLSYPSGTDYRFRYDLKYVHSNILNKKIESLVGQTSILIHVHTKEVEGRSDQVLEFIPIRKATVVEAKNLGDFIQIRFTLDNWFVYEKSSDCVTLNSYHEKIKNSMPIKSKDEFIYGCLFADEFSNDAGISEDLSGNYEKVASNWSKLISHIAKLTPHENSIFLKLLEIKNINNNVKIKPKEFDGVRGFELLSDKTYQIEILQRSKKPLIPPLTLEISTNPDDINIIKENELIQGRYDILKFIISTEDFARKQNSFFMINLEKENLVFRSSHSFYNIKIKPRMRKISLSFLILVGGLVLSALGTTLTGYTHIEGLSVAVPLAGAFISFFGAYMMPKKKII